MTGCAWVHVTVMPCHVRPALPLAASSSTSSIERTRVRASSLRTAIIKPSNRSWPRRLSGCLCVFLPTAQSLASRAMATTQGPSRGVHEGPEHHACAALASGAGTPLAAVVCIRAPISPFRCRPIPFFHGLPLRRTQCPAREAREKRRRRTEL